MNAKTFIRIFALLLFVTSNSYAFEVPIQSFTINTHGQIEIQINSTTNHYYILKVKPTASDSFSIATSMTIGQAGTTTITEPLSNLDISRYKVYGYQIKTPYDTDGDGIDDIKEFNNMPAQSPVNAAPPVNLADGILQMKEFDDYKYLSVRHDLVPFSEYLNGLGFFKFIITDFYSDNPHVYYINTNKHDLHQSFANTIGVDHLANNVKKGQIVYHPTGLSPTGSVGIFAFNYTGGHGDDFNIIEKTHELLGANMPFLKNNLSFFVTDNSKDEYARDKDSFDVSRLPILLEEDVYADVDYWGLNQTEGYGLFRKMTLDEIPGPKDIVLYEAIPNALPRVGGIMTSVIQTPLSHVNLRAIQNKVPNAFIRDPLAIDSIADLLDKYIYFKVEQDKYTIREASAEEVNAWFKDIRPKESQDPPLNLCIKEILPLDNIGFNLFDAFGAKCANVATMRTFGFPAGTIPNGFGIPFYYYQEFMKHNNFFVEAQKIMSRADFIADRFVRDTLLDAFRKKIRAAEMPNWMLNDLDKMHKRFPVGSSVRCRSSTNNEDLPGFNGAGLYTSKTQHPTEGHISKSIKQVYASLWNLRAFEEREFYRVNHFKASMGILCHPNFENEKANGVGVSIDPLYETENTFYLNSQVGEILITNPDSNAHPEEILLDRVSLGSNDYTVIQRSNLSPHEKPVLKEKYLDEMREFLSIIHDDFAKLYKVKASDDFAMDIEYKITSDDQLVIKQARPWVSYALQERTIEYLTDNFDLKVFPNPATDCISIRCEDCNLAKITLTNIAGRQLQVKTIGDSNSPSFHIPLDTLPTGVYFIQAFLENNRLAGSQKILVR